MVRIKRGSVANKRRKKILKINKSFRGSSSALFRIANQKAIKSFASGYKNRKYYKRLIRQLWINRINSVSRLCGISFSQFINLCKKLKIKLNKKIISQLIIYDPHAFLIEFKPYFSEISKI